MGEIAILRAANQADDPQVELALRGIELDAANAKFTALVNRNADLDDEQYWSEFDIAERDYTQRQVAFRQQLAKVAGIDADEIYRRLS